MSFGNRIIEYRRKLGLSQLELSEKIGVHKNMMGRYERDEVKPSYEVANKIAKILGISLDYLVGNINNPINPNLLYQLSLLDELDHEVREHILYAFEAMLRDAQTQKSYS